MCKEATVQWNEKVWYRHRIAYSLQSMRAKQDASGILIKLVPARKIGKDNDRIEGSSPNGNV